MERRPPIDISEYLKKKKSGVPSAEDVEKAIEEVNKEVREKIEEQRRRAGY